MKLKPTLLEDLHQIIQIEKDSSNIEFITSSDLKQHEFSIQDKNQLHLSAFNEYNSLIGFVLLVGTEDVHNAMELRRIIVTEKGKGYGSKIIELIKEKCFRTYKCNRLWLDVFSFNKRALQLYKKHNFKEEGVLRECIKVKEDYRSLVVLSILKKEYKNADN